MGEIVNLRLARKAKGRDDKTRTADENRVRHGRTKAEKQLDRLSAEKSTTFIEGHRRVPTSPSRGEVAPPPGPASGRPEDGAGGGDNASPNGKRNNGAEPDKPRD